VRRLAGLVSSLLVVGCFAVAAVPLYGQITGRWRLLPVLSGSMEPDMTRGDLAWVEPKPLAELAVDDVLVFNSPPRGSTPSRRVIHRVTELVDPSRIRPSDLKPGTVYVRTKGDANPDADPWIAAIGSETVWVRTKIVPELGRPLLATENRSVRILVPLLGAAMLAGWGATALLRKDPEERDAPPTPAPAPAPTPPKRSAPTPRILRPGVVGVAAVGVGVAGLSAAVTAAFYDQETSVNTIAAGEVSLETTESTLSVVVADLLPGDKVERTFALSNDGSLSLGAFYLEVTGSNSPLLDPTVGLQLEVSRCPQAWEVASGTSPSARCSSTPATIVPDRPLLGRTPVDRTLVESDDPDGVDYLRASIRLPDTAPPSLAGQRSTVTLAFVAGQRSPSVR
jgi:signal peptidase